MDETGNPSLDPWKDFQWLQIVLLWFHRVKTVYEDFLSLASVSVAFIGSIVAFLLSGETWNVSSLVGLIGLFGIAV